MDENLKIREAQAVGTSEVLDFELEKTRRRLEEMKQKISTYRARYIGGLPDELETNLQTLDRLQQQMADKHAMLREARNSLALVESQMDEIERQARQRQPLMTSSEGMEHSAGFSGTENQEKLFGAMHLTHVGTICSILKYGEFPNRPCGLPKPFLDKRSLY